MAKERYFNYYTTDGRWVTRKVLSCQNGKIHLGQHLHRGGAFPVRKGSIFTRLLSYELGEPPFYLITGNKIKVHGTNSVLEMSDRLMFARATPVGLNVISSSKNKSVLITIVFDGNQLNIEHESDLEFSLPHILFPFHSWSNSITNFHQLSDVSNSALPVGHTAIDDEDYTRIYSIDANGVLLPPDRITWDALKDLRNSEYSLANPSGEPLLLKWSQTSPRGCLRSKNVKGETLSGTAFWFSDEEPPQNPSKNVRD